MHNPIVCTTGMEPENHMAAQDANYGAPDHWVHDNYQYQPTTMAAEYGSFYAPNIAPMPSSHPPMNDGLMSSEAVRMPPIPAPAHSATMHHTSQLPMLITNQLWPSQITNPVNGGSYSAPAMAIPPALQAPPPPPQPPPPPAMKPSKPSGRSGTQPRRTLTDEERRNMCLYHEENPHVKQSEIGAKFNVERSTVSKVLRWKDKYLCPEDRSTSPIKRSKGKFPDIERALANWVRNQRKSGKDLTDEQIKEKAQYFAASVGNENPMRTASSNWLEKFKQKNNIGPGRLTRRASEANIPDSTQLASGSMSASSPTIATQPSGCVTSPTAGITGARGSPPSATPTEDDKDSTMNGMFDFGVSSGATGDESAGGQQQVDGMNSAGSESTMDTVRNGGFKQLNNMSTPSLQTSFTDTAASGPASSTYSALSPSTPFTFSPDPNSTSAFPDPNFQRPRSQTFPTLDLQFETSGLTGNESLAPKYGGQSTAASPLALEASMDSSQSFVNIDSALGAPPTIAPPHVLHRTTSGGSLRGRAVTPVSMVGGSAPGSPTQDDARKAADTLFAFLQTLGTGAGSPVDETDIHNLLRLTEKLRFPTSLQQHTQQIAPSLLSSRVPTGLGGLSRIPETEVEMGGIKRESLVG